MAFRNFKMVGYVVYGRGSFNQLDEILAPQRKDGKPMIFLLDHFFEGKPLVNRVRLRGNDKIIFTDVTHEPKTSYVDALANQLKEEFGTVSGIIGIGGGSTMDAAKVMAAAVFYEGDVWDMIAHGQAEQRLPTRALPVVTVPTLAATGSEMNDGAVITNEQTTEKSYVLADCLRLVRQLQRDRQRLPDVPLSGHFGQQPLVGPPLWFHAPDRLRQVA